MNPTLYFATASYGEQVAMTFGVLVAFVALLWIADVGGRVLWRWWRARRSS